MHLKHIGLTSSSEENSDRFYGELLGLTKSEPKPLPIELSKAIFNLDTELVMINYQDDHLHFEIFVTAHMEDNKQRISHTCLEIEDLDGFLDKCRRLNVDAAQIPKGDKTLIFIRDFDGNLFEMKSG
jgi:catechol 2,3-dioxygenase-like lactoylglutathione lyase family enzyme